MRCSSVTGRHDSRPRRARLRRRMARRPTNPRELPDALRDAVERTVQATLGSAERSRDRTQGAIDELVDTVDQLERGAEAGIARSRRVVTGAIDERRPATHDDLKELKAELRAIGRRLDAIEERLPAKRAAAKGGPPVAPPRSALPRKRRLGEEPLRKGGALEGAPASAARPAPRSGRPPGPDHRRGQPRRGEPRRAAGVATPPTSTSAASTPAPPRVELVAHRAARRRPARPGAGAAAARDRRSTRSSTTRSCAGPAPGCRRGRCTSST